MSSVSVTGASGRKGNRLSSQTSPYLLQHATNPVDWHPWGPEAFAEARTRDVPILLSVGYSTCYWCHVMERESFESPTIAAMMNERFVCVKVDREERPDVDNLYMTATQVFTGRGGWPMTVFIEPDGLRPFWCGTYFPAEPRPGLGNMPLFPQVLEGISRAWQSSRDEVTGQARAIADAVAEQIGKASAPVLVGHREVERAAGSLLRSFDRANGGFGGAPKFPQPMFLEFLLDARAQAGDDATRGAIDQALRTTLDRLACGGVRDQIGGGFHRYAVDAQWTVPHFEKMLYDNAMLAVVYARAARVFDDDEYRRVVRETLEFVLRELTDPLGGFYSAIDAEVNGREGRNYLWTSSELAQVLDPGDADFAARVFGADQGPNFRDGHHPDDPPSCVLRLDARPETIAERMGMKRDDLLMRLAKVNRQLYAARMRREQPRKDDKVLSEWNGLMVAGMVSGAALFADQRYLAAAQRAAGFVLERMTAPDGTLARSWRRGAAATPGVLEDYALVIHGLLALHKVRRLAGHAGPGSPFLQSAIRLYETSVRLFRGEDMGYYDTRADQADLFLRSRSTYDGAAPCGASVMLHNLIDLSEATGEPSYLDRAVSLLRTLSAPVKRDPLSSINTTRGLLRLLRTERSKRDVETFAAPRAGVEPESSTGDTTPVEIYASVERLDLASGAPAEMELAIRIAPGYHITAADPGPGGGGLVPLRVHLVHGQGVAVYADYPPGELMGAGGSEFFGHRGELRVRVAAELAGPVSGTPLLAVTFQACTETECLRPTTVELDVPIDIGRAQA